MSRHQKKRQRLSAYGLLLITTIFWGAGLVIVKPALEFTTPFRFLLYRYAGAIFFSLPILFHFLPRWKKLKKHLKTILSLELLGTTLSLALLYIGLRQTTAIEASLIASTNPIFIAILAVIFLKEKVENHELLGLSLSFVGALSLTLMPVLLNGQNLQGVSLLGNVLIIMQNLTIASYYVLAKKHYQFLPKFFVTTLSFYLGLISFFALSLWQSGGHSQLIQNVQQDFQHFSVWLASGYMALFGSIIALSTYIKGQEKIEASEAALFTYLQPLIYLPLGVFWLGEQIYWWQLLSLLIIFLGVFIAEKRR